MKQSVWCWPAPEQVLQDVQIWGVFGSYGRGTAVFGGGQVERLQQWPLADRPLSCDALVLTPAELELRLNDGSRMPPWLTCSASCCRSPYYPSVSA